MKTSKANLVNCLFGLFLTATTVRAQSTWNYVISDAGGDSLVTWSVTGSLAAPPGAFLSVGQSSLAVSVVAPGIYTGTYAADGTPQALANPDGSYFQYDGSDVYSPIVQYSTDTAVGNGNESFSLIAPLLPHTGPMDLLYNPGTQSVLLPVNFSNFNPGTYQSVESVFSTPLTVNLTVEAVPEPSILALAVGTILSAALAGRK